jgi:tripartite-type tricarboxylate transporter receptor subunit TctC
MGLVPARAPARVIKKLPAEIVRILAPPDVKAIYLNGCLEAIASNSPAEFAVLIRSDRDKRANVIKSAQICID